MDDSTVIQRALQLEAFNSKRLGKYRRNLNRFANNGMRREDVWNLYGGPMGYWFAGSTEEDTGTIPVMNVIKSSVNTHVSKISQTKVRPFFNPVNSNFDTRFVARQAQVFFDDLFTRQEVAKTATLCARDADVFEYGAVWVDDEALTVKRIAPWEFYVDPAEYNFGMLSDCEVHFKQYPLIQLADKIKGTRFQDTLDGNRSAKCEYRVYYDLYGGKKYHIIGGDIVQVKTIDYKVPPIATIWYEDPIKGNVSTSMVDNQYTLQQQIDSISQKIAIAVALNPANTVFIPKGSDVKASMVSNQIGAIYEYMPIPGVASPVQVSTPSPISPFYLQMLQFYQQQAYEMEGISQLSAQSKKPAGANSGVALDTLQDVESERHNQFLQSYIRFYMAIADLCVEIFPPDVDILPKKIGRASIKWKEIKKQKDDFTIQFTASSSLSKEPKVKLEQLEKMAQMGIVPQSAIARYMEMPDLEAAYGVSTASYDYNISVISRAVRDGDMEFSRLTDLQSLYVEIINEILRLSTSQDKPVYIDRATQLLNAVDAAIDEVAQTQQPAPAPAAPAPMDAGSLKALSDLVAASVAGGIPLASAQAIAQAAHPEIDPQIIAQMFQPAPAPGPEIAQEVSQ